MSNVHSRGHLAGAVTLDPTDARRVAQLCARHAQDTTDLQSLLEMLGLTPTPVLEVCPRSPVCPVGTQRRVRALMWLGWPTAEVSVRIGLARGSLRALIARGSLSAGVVERVGVVYQSLSRVRGPSTVTASRARAWGYEPPWSWASTTIDIPTARPRRRSVDVLEVAHLLDGGCTEGEIARRMGLSVSTVHWAGLQLGRPREEVA